MNEVLAFKDWILICPLFHKVISKIFNIEKYLWKKFQELMNLEKNSHYIFLNAQLFFLEIFFLQNNSIVQHLKKDLWYQKFDIIFLKLQSLVKFILRKSSNFSLLKQQKICEEKRNIASHTKPYFKPNFNQGLSFWNLGHFDLYT